MKAAKRNSPGSPTGLRSGPALSEGSAGILLPILLLVLFILLATGWLMAISSREDRVVEKERPRPIAPKREGTGPPSPDSTWEERTAGWKELLEQSSRAMGETSRTDAPLSREARGAGEVQLEVETLDGAIAVGDPVEIIWSSPDGAEWKKISEGTLKAWKAGDGRVTVKLSPREARLITAAEGRGKVFAVTP